MASRRAVLNGKASLIATFSSCTYNFSRQVKEATLTALKRFTHLQ